MSQEGAQEINLDGSRGMVKLLQQPTLQSDFRTTGHLVSEQKICVGLGLIPCRGLVLLTSWVGMIVCQSHDYMILEHVVASTC
jgi:hypothetical protein